jgi:hypothetical protein
VLWPPAPLSPHAAPVPRSRLVPVTGLLSQQGEHGGADIVRSYPWPTPEPGVAKRGEGRERRAERSAPDGSDGLGPLGPALGPPRPPPRLAAILIKMEFHPRCWPHHRKGSNGTARHSSEHPLLSSRPAISTIYRFTFPGNSGGRLRRQARRDAGDEELRCLAWRTNQPRNTTPADLT